MHLFTLSVVNMHILHNKVRRANNRKIWKLPDFITELVETLTEAYLTEVASVSKPETPVRPAPPQNLSSAKLRRLTDKHYPGEIDKTTENSTGRKRCKVCSDVFRMHNLYSKKP